MYEVMPTTMRVIIINPIITLGEVRKAAISGDPAEISFSITGFFGVLGADFFGVLAVLSALLILILNGHLINLAISQEIDQI